MEHFITPFFGHSVKISYTPQGLVGISFQKKKSKIPNLKNPMAKKIQKKLSMYLSGKANDFDAPIDWKNLQGTEFQKKVWKKMSQIPYGKTKSYGELAQSIKSPGAARAVGTACAKNHVLLAIPCHRVVGRNGLGGFSGGGLGVKRQLLNLEQAQY